MNDSQKQPAVRIALTRHGETEWNLTGRLQGSSDIPLNDTGREQAVQSASRFTAADWHAIATSPLSRAVETGGIIAAQLGLPVVGTYDDLRERHYGAGEGLTMEEVTRLWPDRDYTDLEDRHEVAARGLASLETIAREHPGRSLIVVAHGTLIRELLMTLTDAEVPAIQNAATSIVERVDGQWRILTINGARPANFAAPATL